MAASAEKSLIDVGKRLLQTRLNKDSLVKLLRQAAGALSELGQSHSLKQIIEPLNKSLVGHKLLRHKDNDVRLLVAVCFSEIIRILAPDPPYGDDTLKEIFKLFIITFVEIHDMASPYFTRRVKILQTISALKLCVLMLDICEDLVPEMFKVFFSAVREDHPQSLFQSMLSIMTQVLEENVSNPILDVILWNLLKDEKGVPLSSSRLAVSVIQNCMERLQPLVRGFLVSCIVEKDAIGSELREHYHEIIFQIFQCAPQMLVTVIPNLAQELLTDQVDVRIKAVNLVAKLFAVSGCRFRHEYNQLFVEFLKRFSDKSVDVRVSAVECCKICYAANPSGTEVFELLAALEGRLLDFDDKVRTQAVNTVCDIAQSNLRYIQAGLLLKAMDRLRDKKVSVRRNAMQKLLELYRLYCTRCSDDLLTQSDHLEQIPCRILALCFDKDCKDFRPQNMELVLADDLFPASLSIKERTKHWISVFSIFSSLHMKALNSILCQKRRLQMEMQAYLDLRRKQKENSSEDAQKKVSAFFVKMSTSFVDHSKAEESFQELHRMKDDSIFLLLQDLVNEQTPYLTAQTTRDKLLKKIGNKHPHYEFFRVLSAKCSYNIFSAEHVQCILLNLLSEYNPEMKNLRMSSMNFLLVIINVFPSLLRGSEEILLRLFSDVGIAKSEKLLQVLAKAGPYISVKLSDIYPSLESLCLNGTRVQSKYSVSAIAALSSASSQLTLSDLFEKLLDSLFAGRNVSTVLQSLGYVAQYCRALYESREVEITQFIIQKLFHTTDVQSSSEQLHFDDDFEYSTCKLKIYGLKMLVRAYLPHQATHSKLKIENLLNILLRILPEGDISDDFFSSEGEKGHLRLAAAKSVLRLARRWDLYLTPQFFRLTVMKSRDPKSHVRRSFLEKVNKLLKEHVIPMRYACSFALAASDCLQEIREDAMKYLAEFIRDYGREAQISQNLKVQDSGQMMTNYPEYVVVYLVHILAHDPGFPSDDCKDENAYARFCSPLLVIIQVLLKDQSVEGNKCDVGGTVLYLLSIFRAIKKAEDAVDICMTPRLHFLSNIGSLITQEISHTGISLSRTPGRVLLPSSLYRISNDTKGDKESSKFLERCTIDKSFVERVLHMFEGHSIQPSGLYGKHVKIATEEVMLSDKKPAIKNLPLMHKTVTPMSSTREGRKGSYVLGRELQKTAWQQLSATEKHQPVSPCDPEPAKPIHSAPTVDNVAIEAPSDAETIPEKDMVSSCGSVVMKIPVSLVSPEAEAPSCIPPEHCSLETTKKQIMTEPTTLEKSSSEVDCGFKKEVIDTTKVLPGNRIKLWSPIDKCFYTGTIEEFDSQNSIHKVACDNGDVELLCLANEHWEAIGNRLLSMDTSKFCHVRDCREQKPTDITKQSKHGRSKSSANHDSAGGSSVSSIKGVGTFGQKGAHGRKALSDLKNRNPNKEADSSIAVKRLKRPGLPVSVDTVGTASEVTDENIHVMTRRSRRRKV